MEILNNAKNKQLVNTQRNWGLLLSLGVFFVILGGVGLGMVISLTLVSMLFLGALLIIAGFSQIADVIQSTQWRASLWHAFIAVLYLVAGGLVIYDPFLASSIITMFLASVLIIIGISRFFMAFLLRQEAGWFWLLIAGLFTLALGVMIILQWPISGLWIIGLFISIEMLIDGWSYIFLALSARRHLQRSKK